MPVRTPSNEDWRSAFFFLKRSTSSWRCSSISTCNWDKSESSFWSFAASLFKISDSDVFLSSFAPKESFLLLSSSNFALVLPCSSSQYAFLVCSAAASFFLEAIIFSIISFTLSKTFWVSWVSRVCIKDSTFSVKVSMLRSAGVLLAKDRIIRSTSNSSPFESVICKKALWITAPVFSAKTFSAFNGWSTTLQSKK